MNVLIRPAEPRDRDALLAVLADTFESTWKPQVTAEAAARAPARAERFVEDHAREMRVAELDGVVVGLVHWSGDFVTSLHVSRAYARQGVGGRLLAVAEAAVRDAGMDAVRLETDTFNTASRAFYAARGYVEGGRYPDEEWDSGLTTLLLVKSLRA